MYVYRESHKHKQETCASFSMGFATEIVNSFRLKLILSPTSGSYGPIVVRCVCVCTYLCNGCCKLKSYFLPSGS